MDNIIGSILLLCLISLTNGDYPVYCIFFKIFFVIMSLILSPKPILFSVKANTAPTIHQDLYRICEDTPIGAYEYKQIENSLKIHE